MKHSVLSPFLFCLVLFGGFAHAEEPLQLEGSDGEMHAPLSIEEGKLGAVLYFVSPFCNTSNTFMPDITAIIEGYEEKFTHYVIHAEKGLGLPIVVQHTEQFEVPCLALWDAELALTKQLGATITPEVVVLDVEGSTLYQGRINDLYLGPTQRQQEATQHDLKNALEAIQAGETPDPAKVPAEGCKISGL